MNAKKLSKETVSDVFPEKLRAFRKEIHGYYAGRGRDLPWRKTDDPYRIVVSEIMLQQTQVDRVVRKYEEFIRIFPDFASLHKAPLAEVYRAWQGLGYNRRALALKKIAEAVVEKHGGRLPDSLEELLKLPGIGKATASSIRAFAFNAPEVFIETNIRAVYIHCFFNGRRDVDDKEIAALVERTLDKKRPRVWYNALMDYGAMLKRKFPNPSRGSAHYTTQSPFEGSVRQARGAVLRVLLKSPASSEKEITAKLNGVIDKDLRKILDDLTKEGLLSMKKGRFSIA
jgi:A/G-specific adenine glycosylase